MEYAFKIILEYRERGSGLASTPAEGRSVKAVA